MEENIKYNIAGLFFNSAMMKETEAESMSDDNKTKKEPSQEEESRDKKGKIPDKDLDHVSGGIDIATCPICGGPNDHIHGNV